MPQKVAQYYIPLTTPGDFTVALPPSAIVLSAAEHRGLPVLWVEVEVGHDGALLEPESPRPFRVVAPGEVFDAEHFDWVGEVALFDGRTTLFVYEGPPV